MIKRRDALDRAHRIFRLLEQAIPHPHGGLTARTPLEWLVATILSAQSTDEQVNRVTPALFAAYPTADAYARAKQEELASLIRPVGFSTVKARHLIECGRIVSQRFHGTVPDTMEALLTLPGVGRKTANVLLGNVFGASAIIVDTHVRRVARRLHLTVQHRPEAIEQDLQGLVPQRAWTTTSQRLLLHGRYICQARMPCCRDCVLNHDCSWEGKRDHD